MGIKENLMKINVAREGQLLSAVEHLKQENLVEDPENILIIGTDPNIRLAKLMSQKYPESEIMIIEKDEDTCREAKEKCAEMGNVQIIEGDIFNIDSEDLGFEPDLVVAKDLIHFVDPGEFVKHTFSLMADGALFVASTYPVLGRGAKNELKDMESVVVNDKGLMRVFSFVKI